MTDNAKELLALRDWMREPDHAAEFRLPDLIEWINRRPIALVERLSARQRASVEWERLTSIIRPLIESVCSDGGSDAARLAKAISDALLAKYDIFEKVEP